MTGQHAGITDLPFTGIPLRVLAARWLGLPVSAGHHFLLATGTWSVLGYYREIPAVKTWNAPAPSAPTS